jgi:subtilisin family serine protease
MSDQISFIPVEELEPMFVMSQLSELADWGLVMAGVPEAHQRTKGSGIKVAVLDTGGPNHIDLNANLLPALNASSSPTADDNGGHGTHCAGIIAALQNGLGVLGVAPESHILPVKVLNDNGLSGFDAIERGIRMATAAGVDIISMSLGAAVEPPVALHQAIQQAVAAGIFIFAAAGNDGGCVNWPARYPEVIAVAAIDQSGQIAGFSSRGEAVAVGAPGVGIYSTYLNNGYALLSGTSQATPFVAGIGALLLAWQRANPSIPPIRTVQDMLQRLDDMTDDHMVFAGTKHGLLGYGVPRFANMDWR